VGPAGVGPATKRIQALLQFGYNFTLSWKPVVNLAVQGSIPIEIHFECCVSLVYINNSTFMNIQDYLETGIIVMFNFCPPLVISIL
jgi:hypothetical protein